MGYYLSEIKENLTTGAFSVPGGISTAVYIEWMEDAYFLAKEMGDSARVARYKKVLFSSIEFLKSLQYFEPERIENGLAENVLGGFGNSFETQIKRVDNNRHAVLAMLEHRKNFYS